MALALYTLGLPAALPAVIDTTPFANGYLEGFGEPYVETTGQTFRTPDARNTKFQSFSFFAELMPGYSNPQYFRGIVQEWDEKIGAIVGSALYTSEVRTLEYGTGVNELRFETGGITLKAGRDYVAYLSITDLYDGYQDRALTQVATEHDPYRGGHLVFHAHGGYPEPVYPGMPWYCGAGCSWAYPGNDLSFRMSFTPAIPEPSSWALLSTGLGVLVAAARSRRAAGRRSAT